MVKMLFLKSKAYCFVCFLLLSYFSFIFSAVAQDDVVRGRDGNQLQIGDTVEFEWGRDTYEGEIIEFVGAGWPMVKYEAIGRTRKQIIPNNRVKLVGSANSNEPEATDNESEFRSWADASGKYNVEAKLLSQENDQVKLEKKDGRVITLPLKKLSQKDQDYLGALKKESDSDNPFAGGTPNKKKPRSRSSVAKAKTVTPKIKNSISLRKTAWNVRPDPLLGNNSISNVHIDFAAESGSRSFHKSFKVSLGYQAKFAAVSISEPFEDTSSLITIDLSESAASPPVSIPVKKANLFAASDSGDKILTLRESRGRDRGGLEFWEVADGSAELKTVWPTKSFFDKSGFGPDAGIFIGEDRLLTFGDKITLWDLSKAESIYSINVSGQAKPAFSPGGSQFAIASNNAIYVVDVKNGNILGSIDTHETSYQHLAFSKSGKLLAGMNRFSGAIAIWDMESAELIRQFGARHTSNASILWCGDDYVLVNGQYLMDVKLRTAVWKYSSFGGEIIGAADGRLLFSSKSKLMPIELPHEDLHEKTAAFDPEELLVLKPGTEVSIDFKSGFAANQRNEIIKSLKDSLVSKGIVVSKAAEIQIVCTVKRQKSQTIEVSPLFNPIGRFGLRPAKTEKITFTPNRCSIEIRQKDRKLWGKTRLYRPGGIIHGNKEETTQQAANRLCKPSPSFFKNIEFPAYLAQLPNGDVLGSSTISERGIR